MAFVLKKAARPGEPLDPIRSNAPHAPGAVRSPQVPGEVPDRSSVPAYDAVPVDLPAREVRRPIAEYGSAQRIMGVYEAVTGNESDPARFEQATVSYEELRKADPSLRTPIRPTPGYALSDGTRLANQELAALSAEADSNFVDE